MGESKQTFLQVQHMLKDESFCGWLKGFGVKKNESFERRQLHNFDSDDGKSSHLTSVPHGELSEGFENVIFLKMISKNL